MPGLNVYYDQAYTGSAFAFDTTRKAAWVADSLAADPIAGIRLVAPESSRWDQVAQVHALAYVQAIRTGEPRDLAQSQKLRWGRWCWPPMAAPSPVRSMRCAAACRDRFPVVCTMRGAPAERGIAPSMAWSWLRTRRSTQVQAPC